MAELNRTPEQKARDNIDSLLELAGWKIQPNKKINFNAGLGVAVREYQTNVGPPIMCCSSIKKPWASLRRSRTIGGKRSRLLRSNLAAIPQPGSNGSITVRRQNLLDRSSLNLRDTSVHRVA